MKILLIDNDLRVQKRLQRAFAEDYIIDVASTGEEGENLAYTNSYDLILLESFLPDMDGEDLCSLLKARLKIPVIMMSKNSTVADKEKGFENGADDYIEKPINTRELRARIKASVRKDPRSRPESILKIRNLELDINRKMVTYKGERIKLRKKELLLLEYLIYNKGRVVSRNEILENVWDMNASPFTNTVEVHVKRIRDKIEKPYGQKYIETVHGLGYLLE